jgi:hypothetical protein
LLSINHDKPTIPWDYELPKVDCQEVWQSTWLAWNWVSLARWQARLASGLRISAIGGSDFHQPAELQPEGPLVLARPTTVLWLENLSEDNVLAAMKAGRGYITEGPAGPHLAIKVNGVPMGGSTSKPLTCLAEIRGAKGDTLVWIDATGIIAEQEIHSDDCLAELAILDGDPKTFIRAEIVAKSSRLRLIEEFMGALENRELPWQLQGSHLTDEPIRRAISNPVYIEE